LDKQVVLVTNRDVQDPFIAFDRYDGRSLIEKICFGIPNKTGALSTHLRRPKKAYGTSISYFSSQGYPV
jgi:hypothetical protein